MYIIESKQETCQIYNCYLSFADRDRYFLCFNCISNYWYINNTTYTEWHTPRKHFTTVVSKLGCITPKQTKMLSVDSKV